MTREAEQAGAQRVALVSRTIGDVRQTMIEGESGLQAIYPPDERPVYIKSSREVRFHSGAKALIFTDDEPDGLRGPQFHFAWCDEPGAWPNLRRTWDNLMFGMRLGQHPRVVATTTPKRRRAYRDIFHSKKHGAIRIVRRGGSSYENLENLAPIYRRYLEAYRGSRLARQEIDGIFLEEIEGALWTEATIDQHRSRKVILSLLSRIVVAIDPAVTSTEKSNETGIIVVGVSPTGEGYVLHDGSMRAPPHEWGKAAVDAYHRFQADAVIGEKNNGGDLIEHLISTIDSTVPYRSVTATRGKRIRAEPVSTLYRRGQIHHAAAIDFGDGIEVETRLEDLEDQMVQWDPDHERDRDNIQDDAGGDGREIASPDRVDALVWGVTDLMIDDTMSGDALYRA